MVRTTGSGGALLKVPTKIQQLIGDMPYFIETIGMSNSQILCFDEVVLKVEKENEESDNEHRMMEWLIDKLPVPRIVSFDREEGVNYLLMSRIQGNMACSPKLLANPSELVKVLVDGLKMFWDVDVAECPNNNSIDNKLRMAETRVSLGLCDVEHAEPTTYGRNGFKNPENLLQWLKDNRPEEEFVLSHGDYCLPNIFIKDGQISGFIDLGRVGIADPYQDIALCYRSLQRNYDGTYGGRVYKGFDPKILFDELNLKADWDKIRFFTLLDELF